MALYGMKGAVLHMDSISLNMYGGYRIYLPETGLGVVKLSVNECKQFVFEKHAHKKEAAPIESPIIEETPQQLELFKILTR